jgi:hypothetical protein
MNPDPILDLSVAGGAPRAREVMSAPMRDDDPKAPREDRDSEPADATDDDSREGSDDSSESSGSSSKKSGSHILHEGEFTAPSVGPHTVIERPPPEERLDFDRISDTDAMGKEKKRKVVGGTYGPTRTRVFATFATFFAVVAAIAVGFYFLAKELDQPPKEQADEAPWSAEGADQKRPRQLQ